MAVGSSVQTGCRALYLLLLGISQRRPSARPLREGFADYTCARWRGVIAIGRCDERAVTVRNHGLRFGTTQQGFRRRRGYGWICSAEFAGRVAGGQCDKSTGLL